MPPFALVQQQPVLCADEPSPGSLHPPLNLLLLSALEAQRVQHRGKCELGEGGVDVYVVVAGNVPGGELVKVRLFVGVVETWGGVRVCGPSSAGIQRALLCSVEQ